MAEIWFYSGADKPVEEKELDERPFADCVETLELSEERYLGEDPTKQPATGVAGQERYLVVAVDEDEAVAFGWKPGYYRSPLEPAEALQRLGLEEAR